MLLGAAAVTTPPPADGLSDPYADEVVRFTPGAKAGFGQDAFPEIVLGPPHGGGESQGSLDVLSLGHGGEIVLGFADPVICDGPGVDFTVFENAFRSGGTDGLVFAEVGIVSVSADGASFVAFPYDAETFSGLAGATPVLSHPDNGIDPTDPSRSGGDSFDLELVGLEQVAYVRILDAGDLVPDPGNRLPGGSSAGFDLDAVAIVNVCGAGAPTPSASPSPTATMMAPTTTPTAIVTPTPLRGDADGDGRVDTSDLALLVAELFDGDGDLATAAAGGAVGSAAGVDANEDRRVTAADLTGIARALR